MQVEIINNPFIAVMTPRMVLFNGPWGRPIKGGASAAAAVDDERLCPNKITQR